ncbi:ylmG homolog protein 2, chloroplastic [Gastrolobium bilobum]|uniref:ylmG homolog protein 2, chloroplastic n=1 Tax=Gastrolobium bilobum TaxID=150636 RepID=UPI002AB0C9B6|nr:ylmG homolog protein 2, chloroplastic [Gastrolobium bilobum]
MAVNDGNDSSTEEIETKKVPYCWGNAQTPFALPFLRFRVPNSNFTTFVSPPELRRSITNAADHFFSFLHSLASQNPILNKVLSLSSEFHSLCVQIRCSNYRNMRSLCNHNFAAVLPGDSVAGLVVANGVSSFLSIYNTLLIVRLVLTWFPNSPPAIVSPLSTICDPYLNIFRGLIPPLGGTLDLSPILAFLVLNAFTSTAAALPAELPVTEQSEQGLAAPLQSTHVTTSQKKWMTRLQGKRSKNSGSAI